MSKNFFLILALMFSVAGNCAYAETVTLKQGHLTLNANLELAGGKRIEDGVILMTHGTLAHGRMEIMQALQEELKGKGLSSLSITLSLGLDNRQGMYDCKTPHTHKHTDALNEIGAWVDWLKQRGVKQLVLLGHSRGGNQTAWYASEHNDPAITKVVLIAPATWSEAAWAKSYKDRFHQPLKPALEKAQAQIKKGAGKVPMKSNLLYCPGASVTPESFVSYYAPEPRLDSLSLLPKIKQPVLLIAGTQDEVVPDLDKKAAPLADGKRVKLVVLEGADHFFRDLYAMEIGDHVAEFLTEK